MMTRIRSIARRFERRWLRPWLRRGRALCRPQHDDQRDLVDRVEHRLDDIECVLRELVGLQHLAAAERTAPGEQDGASYPVQRWRTDDPSARR